MACEDDPSDSSIRLFLEGQYRYSFSFSKYLSHVEIKGSYAILTFVDDSTITDQGNRIIAEGSNDQLAAYRLVELALAKRWQCVSFTGDEQFLRLAFEKALDKGLEVQAKNEAQQQVLDELKRERSGMGSAIGASSGVKMTVQLDDIRKKDLRAKLLSGNTKSKNKKRGWRKSGT
jgi:hypothetical protein